MKLSIVVPAAILLSIFSANPANAQAVSIGCKQDKEGLVLAEIMGQLLEDRGFKVERRFGLGGTLYCFSALRTGAIDVYPEYSGTLERQILEDLPPGSSAARIRQALKKHELELLEFFGFNNTYAIAVPKRLAEERGLKKIGDLARYPDLRYGFTHEFLDRRDGWPGMAQAYGLSAKPVGLEHGLAYEAISNKTLDVTDAYSTDGDIAINDLVLLEDDQGYLPKYLAAPLVRAGLDDEVKAALEELRAKLNDAEMQALNEDYVVKKHRLEDVARKFLTDKGLLTGKAKARQFTGERRGIDWMYLLSCTVQHLKLTLIALVAGMVVAIPSGILIHRYRSVARPVIYVAGVLQTIPSLALLALMIPLFNQVGVVPAIAALFLYALLPMVRNTAAALFSIDPLLRKVAVGMGMTTWQRLRYVELPLAAPTLLAGIKTAAIINIGTATLATYIGAGGLGDPIARGLALNDKSLILQGAIPAALLALATEFGFEWLERLLVPRHLLQKAAE